jgi:hypothetical protein
VPGISSWDFRVLKLIPEAIGVFERVFAEAEEIMRLIPSDVVFALLLGEVDDLRAQLISERHEAFSCLFDSSWIFVLFLAFLTHNFSDLLGYTLNVKLSADLGLLSKDLMHITLELREVLLSDLGDKSADVVRRPRLLEVTSEVVVIGG